MSWLLVGRSRGISGGEGVGKGGRGEEGSGRNIVDPKVIA